NGCAAPLRVTLIVPVRTCNALANCAPVGGVTYALVPGSNSVNLPALSPAMVTLYDDRLDLTLSVLPVPPNVFGPTASATLVTAGGAVRVMKPARVAVSCVVPVELNAANEYAVVPVAVPSVIVTCARV